MAFLPAFARAEGDINVDARGNAQAETATTISVLPPALGLAGDLRTEWEAKKKAMLEIMAERREALRERFEDLKDRDDKDDNKISLGARFATSELADLKANLKAKFRGGVRGDIRGDAGLKVGANATTTATTTTGEIRLTVRAVATAWNDYRATVHVAEKVYKKSEHNARVILMQTLRAAAKAKDGAAAAAAVDMYFKSEATADAQLDAVRASAREELKADLKVILS